MKNTKTSLLTLLPLFLVIVIDTMGSSLVMPVLSPLFLIKAQSILPDATSLVMREFIYGITLASFCALMLFGAPFLGDLSDYFGRKKVLLISLLGTGASYTVSGYGIITHSIVILIIGRCIAGFFAGSQPIAQAAIADMSTPETKAGNLSSVVFAASLGFIVGPIIGGYFANPANVSWFNYATPFFVAALIAIINALFVMVTLKRKVVQRNSKTLKLTRGLFSFISAFTYKPIRLSASALFLMQTGFSIYFAFLPLFMVQVYHYHSGKIGHFMAYMGICWAIAFLFLIRVILRFLSLEKAVILGFIVVAVALLLVAWPSQWITWLTVIPIAIFNGLSYTSIMTLLSNSTSPDAQGWIMGIISAVIAAAWGLGTLFAGILGSYFVSLPFIIAALLTLLSLGIFMLRKFQE